MRRVDLFVLGALCGCLSLSCAAPTPAFCQEPARVPLPVTIADSHDAGATDWRTFLRKNKTPVPAPAPVPLPTAAVAPAAPAAAATAPATAVTVPAAATGGTAVVTAPPATPTPEPLGAATNGPAADRFLIGSLDIRGDSNLLDQLGVKDALLSEIIGKQLTEKQMLDLATKYQELCARAGYYLARIRVVPADFGKGALTYEVDKGRIGRMSFYDGASPNANESENKTPFAGKYYSEAQLRRQLGVLKEEDTFDYNDFYRAVFTVNAHPDVKMDTNLRLRKDLSTGTEKRYADMEFFVREGTPFHGVLEVKNTGTESTDEWRTSITLQHLNLTRHNDILTVNTLSAVDLSSLLSFAASYSRPFSLGNGGALTVYGGYSDVQAEEIVPEIDLIGTGWFACLQASYNLVSDNRRLLNMTVGATCKGVENKLSFQNCDTGGPQEQTVRVTLIPMDVALNYSSVKPDRLGGRNFLTSQTGFNIGGSDGDELAAQRLKAQANYIIERIQAARLQPLFGRETREGARSGEWILFLKADGQIASGPLVPAEQKAAGGMDSVRGYPERESLGDDGISGTIELRTPLMAAPFGRLFRSRGQEAGGEAAGEGTSRLQFVGFVDAAYVSLKEPVEGSDTSQSLLGAGAGLRLAVTSHFQLRFDWGFPLAETTTSKSSGRGHLSLQAQF